MKKNRIGSLLLAVLLVVSMMATTVSATSLSLSEKEAVVYIDDKEVKKIDAYVDNEGDFYVSTLKELYRIFPDLEGESLVIASDKYSITDCLEKYTSYSYHMYDNKLYIFTKDEISIDLGDILDKFEEDKKADKYNDKRETATVFVNGLRISTKSAFVSDGEAYVEDFDDVYKLFKETKYTYLPFENEVTCLKDWAERYNYAYVVKDTYVYLNNDGNLPVQITLNRETVEFDDQQPVIVPPGRTMVPISSIAGLIGADVTWDPQNNRVIIKDDSNVLLLWINSNRYWLNGNYHKMDVKPYILNGRTMVPIAFVGEAFGLNIRFKNNSDIAVVKLSST